MNIKKLLGRRIQELRKSRKLTQEKVAEIIGIETGSLSNIENGKYYPTAENLEKIIKAMDITPDKLFAFEHLQGSDELITEINEMLKQNPKKIQEVYKIVKVIVD